jgi:hypothetical protein
MACGFQMASWAFERDLASLVELWEEPVAEEWPFKAMLQEITSTAMIYEPLPEDDPKRRKPVIDRAAQLLDWKPRVALERGLQATIDYFSLKIFTPDYACVAEPVLVGAPRRHRRDRPSASRLREVQ